MQRDGVQRQSRFIVCNEVRLLVRDWSSVRSVRLRWAGVPKLGEARSAESGMSYVCGTRTAVARGTRELAEGRELRRLAKHRVSIHLRAGGIFSIIYESNPMRYTVASAVRSAGPVQAHRRQEVTARCARAAVRGASGPSPPRSSRYHNVRVERVRRGPAILKHVQSLTHRAPVSLACARPHALTDVCSRFAKWRTVVITIFLGSPLTAKSLAGPQPWTRMFFQMAGPSSLTPPSLAAIRIMTADTM